MIKLRKNLFEGDGPLTQRFGENPDVYAQFGLKGHNGIDYGIPTGTKLYSAINGVVTEVANDTTGYGKYIKIENDECGILYGHMKALSPIPVGMQVVAGQEIGESNNTGNSTGPHLHFGIFPKPRDRQNGYAGYIDPLGDQIEWVEEISPGEDCSELIAENKALEDQINELRDSRDKWKRMYSDLEDKYKLEVSEKQKTIDTQQTQIASMKHNLELAMANANTLNDLKEKAEAERDAWKKKYTDDMVIVRDALKRAQTTVEGLQAANKALNNKVAILEKDIKQTPWFQIFRIKFRR